MILLILGGGSASLLSSSAKPSLIPSRNCLPLLWYGIQCHSAPNSVSWVFGPHFSNLEILGEKGPALPTWVLPSQPSIGLSPEKIFSGLFWIDKLNALERVTWVERRITGHFNSPLYFIGLKSKPENLTTMTTSHYPYTPLLVGK